MPKFTVSFRGISGPGAGGEYVYAVKADSPAHATDLARAKADRLASRLNRGGTRLDPNPTSINQL